MKPLLHCLLAALVFQASATAVRACQYCRLAATDPDMAKLAAQMHAKEGGFPLDAALNKFQAVAPAAVLTAPPPSTSIATTTADLPTALPRHALPPTVAKSLTPAPAPTVSSPVTGKDTANRWANGGLLGLMGLAGVFGWRTRGRRTGGSVS